MAVLNNIRIVLVGPRGAVNIGAAARAMKNTGLHDLVLVRSTSQRRFAARAMAVHAGDVLARARVVESLGAAISDCALVVGTTARAGLYRSRALSPRALAPEIVRRARRQRVAIVFGPEDHGLSNEDLKQCHRLVTIPASAEYPSFNLAQAVMICGYEIFVAASTGRRGRVGPELVTAGEVEFLCERLQEAFLRIGFLHGDNPDHIMMVLRQFFGRAGIEDRDLRVLLALARQIEWYGSGGWRVSEERRAAGRPVK